MFALHHVALGFHRPHLPFVAPQTKYDLYPLDSIELPADQQPPTNMPDIAWSNSGELVSYGDIHTMRNGTAFAPGDTLPPQTVRELRRGYYAAVSHLDDELGRVVDALAQYGFADNTIVSFWGDQYVHSLTDVYHVPCVVHLYKRVVDICMYTSSGLVHYLS